MKAFNSMRRDFLRTGSLGMAAAAIPAVSLAAAGPDSVPASEPPRRLFDVRKYGATGDGKTLDTDAVNRAIEVAAAGGGVVVFPAGSYLCFSIRLKSQVHLLLEQGSAIVAADSPMPGDLPAITAEFTTRPSRIRTGMPIRTTVITTGITR